MSISGAASPKSGAKFEFDRATFVRRVDSGEMGNLAEYECVVADGWDILGNANGGYLLAILGRAARSATGRNDVVSASIHYLAPVSAGPARVRVEIVRSGRRFATAMASLVVPSGEHQREAARALLTLGDLDTDPGGPSRAFGESPDVVAHSMCLVDDGGNWPVGIRSRLDCRIDPRDAGIRGERRSGDAIVRGWLGFADDRPMDSLALLLACDAFPPAVFNTDLPLGWVPTMDLSFQIRARPTGGPIMCSFRTRHLANGLLEEDGELWDQSGALLALSRQLALAPRA